MMNALKLRAESYNEWALNVNEALEAKINKKKSMWYTVWLGDWQIGTDHNVANIVINKQIT